MIINGEKRKIAMEIAYILMLMSAAMGDLKVFSVSQTRMMKAISLFIVVMAATYLFISSLRLISFSINSDGQTVKSIILYV